ncbi:MAG: tRNA pseudouridine(13) synthase TruD [Promethearchaeota archaeon]|nr:MAG: tRNA pseudouridine(13) synthase TruD [Candidatus Lokiarchaeota archaeon]
MGFNGQGIRRFQNQKEIEKFVGIKAYAFPECDGIGGVYKHRHEDFIVKEITKSGEILTNYDDGYFIISDQDSEMYTTFILQKNNIDTFEAIHLISKALKVPKSKFSYSGLKDKRSISLQKIAIKGNYGEELHNLRIPGISISKIHHSSKPIKIGSNQGNYFVITIRNIEKDTNLRERAEKILDLVSTHGFLNYYGLQRFGTFRPNSHLIGKFLLKNSFKQVFDEFVTQLYSSESEQSLKVRSKLRDDNDLEWASKNFPKSLNYELMMIQHLIEKPNDFQGSVNRLPQALIRLLISSFQSYLFNELISLRVEKGYPLFEPVKGDVISILDDVNGDLTHVSYIFGNGYDQYLLKALAMNRGAIVAPLIGYDTNLNQFPLFNELFIELLEKENFNRSIFNSHYFKEFEFKGAFRAMINKPQEPQVIEIAEDDNFPGKMKMKISFSLKSGSYATMLLRELMK